MLDNARTRALAAGVPFLLKREDIVVPTHCPILGIPLFQTLGRKGGGPNSPSLDRIEPHLGYVPGNILVISGRANRLKSDATIEELRKIASFYATFERRVRVKSYRRKNHVDSNADQVRNGASGGDLSPQKGEAGCAGGVEP